MPAFSFTKEKKQPSFVRFDPLTPNVGQYNLSEIKFNSRIKTAPSISLPKAKRYQSQKKVVPGPGAYQIEKEKQKSQKGISMKGSHEIKLHTEGPGPLSYSPHVSFPTKKFSFPKDSSKKLVIQGPDPFTYNVKFDSMTPTSKYIFAKSQRQPLQRKDWMKNVGPGSHLTKDKLVIEQRDHFSFTKAQKFKDNKIESKQKLSIPGVGRYDVSNARQNHNSIKFAMAAKTLQIKEQVPGVGAYDVSQKEHLLKNGIKIGKQKRVNNESTNFFPGPGEYETQVLAKLKLKQAPKVVFPKSPRMKSTSVIVVGPGDYNIGQDVDRMANGSSKGFTISSKTFKEKVQLSPGPQSYNPDFKKVYSSCERPVFNKSKKTPLILNKNPGPGAYETQQKRFSKTFYFNRADERTLENKSDSRIGPGQYKLKPFFGQYEGKDKSGLKFQSMYV